MTHSSKRRYIVLWKTEDGTYFRLPEMIEAHRPGEAIRAARRVYSDQKSEYVAVPESRWHTE